MHANSLINRMVMLALVAGFAWPLSAEPAGQAGAKFTPPRGRVAIIDGKESVPPSIPMGDDATNRAILAEGKQRNQVMEHLRHLAVDIGPRLTGSTRLETAKNWARDRFVFWGLTNAHLEPWGTLGVRFDRGPCSGKVLLRETKKGDDGTERTEYTTAREMQVSALAWTPGTQGAVRGRVFRLPTTEDGYAAIKADLAGNWILLPAPPGVGQRGIRSRISAAFEARREARKAVEGGADPTTVPIAERVIFDGIAGFISTSRDERVWAGTPTGWRDFTMESLPKDVQVSVRLSDYDFLNSRLVDGEPVEVELNLDHRFTPGPITESNVIAEIPGTSRPDQVVMISAHLDSWDTPGSQGTTDNGTGSSVTLEAARILMAVGAKPKRTIRFVLWSGEEQGLLGSKHYVETHKDELANISAVFVDDGGTNSEGGLPVAEQMIPMLAAATSWTNYQFFDSVDGKWLNVNLRPTGRRISTHSGSDHAPFNSAGVPGFFWDEIGRADYGQTWHTQNDRFEFAIPSYLWQSSTNAALVAYNLACMPDLLPRSDPAPSGEETPRGPMPPGTQMPNPPAAATRPTGQ